jgi:hypothetical protein
VRGSERAESGCSQPCRSGEGGSAGLVDLKESWVSPLGSEYWIGSEVLSFCGVDWW